MPPKDPVKTDGLLYFLGDDGQLKPIGHITASELDFYDEATKPYMHEPLLNDPIEFEVKFEKPIGSRMMVSLLTGKWLSNNWLKMHGLPMERKGYRGKHR